MIQQAKRVFGVSPLNILACRLSLPENLLASGQEFDSVSKRYDTGLLVFKASVHTDLIHFIHRNPATNVKLFYAPFLVGFFLYLTLIKQLLFELEQNAYSVTIF